MDYIREEFKDGEMGRGRSVLRVVGIGVYVRGMTGEREVSRRMETE